MQVGSPIISLASGRHAEAENSSASVAAESSQNRKFITSGYYFIKFKLNIHGSWIFFWLALLCRTSFN